MRGRTRGFSLIEILVVVAILAALAGLAVTFTEPSPAARLQLTADMLAADLERVQELALSRGSPHRATFEGAERRFIVKHVGSNSVFNNLPKYMQTRQSEARTQATYAFDERSAYGKYVTIAAFEPASIYVNDEFPVQFAADGSLADGRTATIWLRSMDNGRTMFLPVRIYAVTGVVSVGTTVDMLPPAAAIVQDED
jgi:prepilin-type N-terminal cleavage/methylation domain-containing protein